MANNNIHINDIPLDIFLDYFNKVNVNKTMKDETGNLQNIGIDESPILIPKVNQNHEIISKESSFTSALNNKIIKHQNALRKENIIDALSTKNEIPDNPSGVYLENDGKDEELVFYDKVVKRTKYNLVDNADKNISNKLLYEELPSNKEETIYFKNSIAKLSDYPKYMVHIDEFKGDVKPATKIKYNGEYYIFNKITNNFIKQGEKKHFFYNRTGEFIVTNAEENQEFKLKYDPDFYLEDNSERIIYKKFEYDTTSKKMTCHKDAYTFTTADGTTKIDVPEYDADIGVPVLTGQTVLSSNNTLNKNLLYIYYHAGTYYKNPFIEGKIKFDITEDIYNNYKDLKAGDRIIFQENHPHIIIEEAGFYPLYLDRDDYTEDEIKTKRFVKFYDYHTIVYGEGKNAKVYRYREFSFTDLNNNNVPLFDGTRFTTIDVKTNSPIKTKNLIDKEIVRLSLYTKEALIGNKKFLVNERDQIKLGFILDDIKLEKTYINILNVDSQNPFILIPCRANLDEVSNIQLLTNTKNYSGTFLATDKKIKFESFEAFVDKVDEYNFNIRIKIDKIERSNNKKELLCEITRTMDKKYLTSSSIEDTYSVTGSHTDNITKTWTEIVTKTEVYYEEVKKKVVTPVYPVIISVEPQLPAPSINLAPVLYEPTSLLSQPVPLTPIITPVITPTVSTKVNLAVSNLSVPTYTPYVSYGVSKTSSSLTLNSGRSYSSFSAPSSLSFSLSSRNYSVRSTYSTDISSSLRLYNSASISEVEYKVTYEYEKVARTREFQVSEERTGTGTMSFSDDEYSTVDSKVIYAISKNSINEDQFVIYNSFYLEDIFSDSTSLNDIAEKFDLTDDYQISNNKLTKTTYFKNYNSGKPYYRKTIEYDNNFNTLRTLEIDTKNILFLGKYNEEGTFQNIFHSNGKYKDIPVQNFKGKRLSDSIFFEKKKEKLNQSLLNILNNKSSNIDIVSETISGDGYINIYNFCKGVENFVRKDTTSTRKIVNQERQLKKLDDIDYEFILSENDVVNTSSTVDLKGPLRVTNQTRDLLTSLYESSLYPLNIKYEKEAVHREEIDTKNSVIDGNVNFETVNRERPRVPDFQKNFYKENFDNLLMLLSQEIFNFAKNKSIVSKTNLSIDSDYYKMYYQRKINQLSNDFHTVNNSTVTSNKRLYWNENSVDNLLNDLLKVDNNKHWEVTNE